MQRREGLPFIKLMMLLSSMAPLFVLVGLRGISVTVISETKLWGIIAGMVVIPYLFLWLRLILSKNARDIITIDASSSSNNKDYLFTYLFTVLLPLYSFTISSNRDAIALAFALLIVLFVLWNMNLHFINIIFAFGGYKVFTIPEMDGAVLLTTRHSLSNANQLLVHRLSNSVFIEFKDYNYGI